MLALCVSGLLCRIMFLSAGQILFSFIKCASHICHVVSYLLGWHQTKQNRTKFLQIFLLALFMQITKMTHSQLLDNFYAQIVNKN